MSKAKRVVIFHKENNTQINVPLQMYKKMRD